MDARRIQRVASLLRDELAELVLHEVKDPRIDTLLSITDVEVARDASFAKVFVSYYGDAAKREEIIAALNHAAGFLQKEIAKRVKLRSTPRLAFYHDVSIERGFRVTEVLKKIKHEP
ncbi:MAG: 30S ribosome-binding factor RbfA [Spirochaetales bacterium]|nr:30S ribosome-binding factor RbfA [Spirochaetales bacterium]